MLYVIFADFLHRRKVPGVTTPRRQVNGKACCYTLLHDGSGTPETGPCSKLAELQTNSRHAKLPTARYRVADEAGSANAVLPGIVRDAV